MNLDLDVGLVSPQLQCLTELFFRERQHLGRLVKAAKDSSEIETLTSGDCADVSLYLHVDALAFEQVDEFHLLLEGHQQFVLITQPQSQLLWVSNWAK
jgi:hypothetical protein